MERNPDNHCQPNAPDLDMDSNCKGKKEKKREKKER